MTGGIDVTKKKKILIYGQLQKKKMKKKIQGQKNHIEGKLKLIKLITNDINVEW